MPTTFIGSPLRAPSTSGPSTAPSAPCRAPSAFANSTVSTTPSSASKRVPGVSVRGRSGQTSNSCLGSSATAVANSVSSPTATIAGNWMRAVAAVTPGTARSRARNASSAAIERFSGLGSTFAR